MNSQDNEIQYYEKFDGIPYHAPIITGPIRAVSIPDRNYRNAYSAEEYCSYLDVKSFSAFMAMILNEKIFLAGGFFRKLLDPADDVKDLDVFFENPGVTEEIRKRTINVILQFFLDRGYSKSFRCEEDKLLTLKSPYGIKVQFILEEGYKSNSDLLRRFDLDAGCFSTTGNFSEVCTFDSSVLGVLTKTVRVRNMEFPNSTLMRIMKYKSKGYKVHYAIRDYQRVIGNILGLTTEQIEGMTNGRFYID